MKTSQLILALVLAAAPAGATEWHVFGARALGMGGAGVAVAQGPLGSYWNPAGLGQADNTYGVAIPVGAHLEMTGPVVEGANDLQEVAEACRASGGAATGSCSQTNIDAALAKINRPGNGLRSDVGVGFDLKIKRAALFVNGFGYIGGKPQVSTTFNNPNNLSDNQSKLIMRGISVTEIGVGYGRELPGVPGLLAGANLKALFGRVGYHQVAVVSNDVEGGGLDQFNKSARESVQPGIDVGLLWDVDKTVEKAFWRPRVGLSARNLNNPKFKQPAVATRAGESSEFALNGQARLGVAINPLRFWTIAADADLTRNLTPVDGVASQNVSLGTEIALINKPWLSLPLRMGVTRNWANPGAKGALTLGAGFNFAHIVADLAVHSSPATHTVQTVGGEKKAPANVGFVAQVGLQFGGAKQSAPKVQEP